MSCGSRAAPLRGQLGAMTFDLLRNARRRSLRGIKRGERCFARRPYAKFCLTAMIDGWFLSCLFIVPGPLSIKFMTRGFVQAEIDKLKGREQFTTKFTSEFERNRKAPPPAKSTRSAQQSAPPASGKKPQIKKKSRQALVDLPEDVPEFIGRGVAIASHFNMFDFNSLLKVNRHVSQNGQWELFPTPKNGSCLFASIRRGIAAPEEYRNNHLRYQLVYFLCQHADFMVNVLDLHLSANYGMDRLSKEDFQKAEKDGTLTKAQREAQTLPGPFSYVEYLENLLNESFWGDHGVLLSLSMMWQVTITSLTAETYEEHRVRHKRRLPYVDLLVVWSGESHYLGTCKFSFITYIFFLYNERRLRGVCAANGDLRGDRSDQFAQL